MEITITVNGKPVKATVDEKEMREAMGEKEKKRTGYEHDFDVEWGYYCNDNQCSPICQPNREKMFGKDRLEAIYEFANYYIDENVAKNNTRADALMRKLRRFAAEHGGCSNPSSYGHEIFYDKDYHTIEPIMCTTDRAKKFGSIIFQSSKTAKEAIETFKDDLLWYFTEYDPMPEGWWDD